MAAYLGQVNDMPTIPLTSNSTYTHTASSFQGQKSDINTEFLKMIGQPEPVVNNYLGQVNSDFTTVLESPTYSTAYANYLGQVNTEFNDAFLGMAYAENYHEWTGTDFIGTPNNIGLDSLQYVTFNKRNIEVKLKGQLWPKIGGMTRYGEPW